MKGTMPNDGQCSHIYGLEIRPFRIPQWMTCYLGAYLRTATCTYAGNCTGAHCGNKSPTMVYCNRSVMCSTEGPNVHAPRQLCLLRDTALIAEVYQAIRP